MFKEKNFLFVLKGGIYFSFVSLLLVWDKLYFPYITSKHLFFNILMEVLLLVWALFIFLYPKWRPKISLIFYSLAFYFLAVLVSCFFGLNFHQSFWGDAERMWGWFEIIHFFIFFLVLITIFRTKKDWLNFFLFSILASSVICIQGIYQHFVSPDVRISATFGNPAYLAVYSLLSVFISSWLFTQFKNKIIKIACVLSSLISVIALFYTGTRGAYLGLVFGLAIFVILIIILNKNRKIKIAAVSTAVVGMLVLIFLFASANQAWIKNNYFLSRVTGFSLKDNTIQTRLSCWKSAFAEVGHYPLFGVGTGNYAIVFDKHFDPNFYNISPAETFFDRTHNNIVEHLSTTGILGLGAYLFIFIAAFIILFRERSKKITNYEFAFFSAFLIAFFTQNLLLFDSLAAFFPFIYFLAFLSFIGSKQEEVSEESEIKKITTGHIIFFSIFALFIIFIISEYNLKPARVLYLTIEGSNIANKGDVYKGWEMKKQAMNINSVLDKKPRNDFVNFLTSNADYIYNKLSPEQAGMIIKSTIDQAEKAKQENPKEVYSYLSLYEVYMLSARFYMDSNTNLANYYFDLAGQASEKAIATSPGRVRSYFNRSIIFAMQNNKESSLAAAEYALSLNSEFNEATCFLAGMYINWQEDTRGYDQLDKCLANNGASSLSADLRRLAAEHYAKENNYAKVVMIYESLVPYYGKDADFWLTLSDAYTKNGQVDLASKAAAEAYGLKKD